MTISALSRANGLAASTLANAFRLPWPKGEKSSLVLLVLNQKTSGLAVIKTCNRPVEEHRDGVVHLI